MKILKSNDIWIWVMYVSGHIRLNLHFEPLFYKIHAKKFKLVHFWVIKMRGEQNSANLTGNLTENDTDIFILESSIVPHTAFNPTDCLPNGLTGPGDPYSDFGQSSNSDLSNFRSSNHSGDHQFNQSAFGMNDDSMVHQLIPTPHNTIDENDEYFTVSGPIFLTVS